MSDITAKYLKISMQRAIDGVPLGEICFYCHSRNSKPEVSVTGRRCCDRCGAPMPAPFAMFAGIPVYDHADVAAILEAYPIGLMVGIVNDYKKVEK